MNWAYIGFLAYLVTVLGVGVYASRFVKTTKDFYIGGRTLGPWVHSLTVAVTWVSGAALIGNGGLSYFFGYSATLYTSIGTSLGIALAYFFVAKPLYKISKNLDILTIPEFFEKRFNSFSMRIISAVVIILFVTIYLIAQYKAIGVCFKAILGWEYSTAVIISTIIFLVYTLLGGMLAVAWSDAIQACIVVAGMITVAIVALFSVGGFSQLNAELVTIKPYLVKPVAPFVFTIYMFISFLVLFGLGTMGLPQVAHRFYMAKDIRVFKWGALIAVIVANIVAFTSQLSGLTARVLVSKGILAGFKDPDLAIPLLTNHLLPSILAGIILAGLLGVIMSTTDSLLLLSATTFSHDIYKFLVDPQASETKMLLTSRIFVIIVGVGTMILALYPPKFLYLMMALAYGGMASAFAWPIFFGSRRPTTTSLAAGISMIGGIVTTIVFFALKKLEVKIIFHEAAWGIVVSLVLMVILIGIRKPSEAEIQRGQEILGA